MRTEILMVTYLKDLPWAEYSLRSVAKFCTGFRAVKIVVPHSDVDAFKRIADPYSFQVFGFDEPEGKGMLADQAEICRANEWCPNADAILHMDADCIAWDYFTPDDFLVDRKPVMYREKFEDFRERHPIRYGWRAAVHKAIGIDPVFEGMVRHPSIHLRDTYANTQWLIERTHGLPWKDYILSCENSYPQGFAEFPTLAAVAIHNYSDRYHWIDYASDKPDYQYERGRDRMKAFWSHAGLDAETDRHPGRTAREVIEEILK